MKIAKVKTHNIRELNFGDVCICHDNNHYYLVVKSENDKKQLIDLSENLIVREGAFLPLIPVDCELTIKGSA